MIKKLKLKINRYHTLEWRIYVKKLKRLWRMSNFLCDRVHSLLKLIIVRNWYNKTHKEKK